MNGTEQTTTTTTRSALLALAGPAESCAHFDCANAATDQKRGMPLCRGHFFWALQLEQERVSEAGWVA